MTVVQELALQQYKLDNLMEGPALSIWCDIRSERVADQFWNSGFGSLNEYYMHNRTYENYLLMEGVSGAIKRQALNVVQAALGWGAEVGITVAGAGSTAPAGVAAETAVDVAFAAGQTGAAMAAVSDIQAGAGEAQDIWDAFGEIDMAAGLDGIYGAVEEIVQNAVSLAKKLKMKLSEFFDKLSKKLEGVLGKIAGAIGDLISMLIPSDAGVGGAAIQEVIVAGGSRAYSMMSKAYNILPGFATKMVEDPEELVTFMDSVIEIVKQFVNKMLDEEEEAEQEDEGFFEKVAEFGLDTVKRQFRIMAFFATLGMSEAAFFAMRKNKDKILEWLDGPVRAGLKDVARAVNTLLPWAFAVLAFFEIVVDKGYVDEDEDEDEDEDKEESDEDLEEAAGMTSKYDDDSALKGDQDELPDALQKGIIDKTVEDREKKESQHEAAVRAYVRAMLLSDSQLKEILEV